MLYMRNRSKAVEVLINRIRGKRHSTPIAPYSLRDIYLPSNDAASDLCTVDQLNISNMFGTVHQRNRAGRIKENSQLRDLFWKFSESPVMAADDARRLPYPERSSRGLTLSDLCNRMRSQSFRMILVSRILFPEYSDLVATKMRAKLHRLEVEQGEQGETSDGLESHIDDNSKHSGNGLGGRSSVRNPGDLYLEVFSGAELNSVFWALDNEGLTPFDFWRTWSRASESLDSKYTTLSEEMRPKAKGLSSLASAGTFLFTVLNFQDLDLDTVKLILNNDRGETVCESAIVTESLYGGEEGINHILMGLSQPWTLDSVTRDTYKESLDLFTLLASYDLTHTETGSGRLLHLKRSQN